ncbi:pyridoxamine 5'-phosphate oxidase family protein [Pseudonocardia yuanmonensis]|uniref:Pyridoxamine 5'-phosphate oxidase family protein n=1 Tax=Pseudonocardia yuanmonensis TaxID=1095914 RepID=A0ABP8XJU9_9PSEU
MDRRTGFHSGELAVQRRAGVDRDAARLIGMLDAPDLRGGLARSLAERTFLAITAHDRTGRLWITPLVGSPGFVEVRGPADLLVHAVPPPGDPLEGLGAGQQVGILALDPARRRRVRVNGTLSGADERELAVHVDQAYGNCPRFIHPRDLEPAPVLGPPTVRRGQALAPADVDLVRRADTFLLGTSHPTRGADASHRGGRVVVEDARTLYWPDLPGNNMFNSLGNIAADPAAALVFVDFATGGTVHLSGQAEIDWAEEGRGVRFTVEALVSGPTLALRERREEHSTA